MLISVERAIPAAIDVAELRQRVLQALADDGWPPQQAPGFPESWPRLEELLSVELERVELRGRASGRLDPVPVDGQDV
jgi:hypothetical protein